MLLWHLKEAEDALRKIIVMLEEGRRKHTEELSNEGLEVDVAHLYYHINSAWNTRVFASKDDPELFEKFREHARFPKEFESWAEYNSDEEDE
jgi:hypothetical protein